jgi:hypothetical protein
MVISDRDIRERDITETDIRESDIGENVATCRSAEWLLLLIEIRGVSGCLSFSQSWRRWARFLRRHKLQILQRTEGVSLRSSWMWGRLQGVLPWGRRWRLWPWGMLTHLLALFR